MKGVHLPEDLYSPGQLVYADGQYNAKNWRGIFLSVGNDIKRIRYLGDRILDRLEARALRDQEDLPPGMLVLVNRYRQLRHFAPVRAATIWDGMDLVYQVQESLLPPKLTKKSNGW